MLADAGTLSWYSSGSSAYVIQGVSVTVRGQAKLVDEGEPQGEHRQAPEPPDTSQRTWGRQARADERREDLRRFEDRSYRMSAPLHLINVLEN